MRDQLGARLKQMPEYTISPSVDQKLAAVEAWACKYLEPPNQEVQHFTSAWEFDGWSEEYDGEKAANELRCILGWPEKNYD